MKFRSDGRNAFRGVSMLRPLRFFSVFFLLFLAFTPAFADFSRSIHHDLLISLEPGKNRLSGTARTRIDAAQSEALGFEMSRDAQVKSVTVNGSPRSFIFQSGRLRVPILSEEKGRDIDMTVEYSALFNDPIPEMPINTDTPGYGVTGVISEKGTFLLGGAGWYPQIPGTRPTYNLTVEAPEGILAVSAGKCAGHTTREGKTFSRWEIDFPLQGLSLSAGPYRVQEKTVRGISVSTYFFAQTQDLSESYLDAAAKYLVFYENLFGPYPFPKFSVVENFFPAGYGFPSYTVLGGTVIRLPFILETSLGHEIAHCWWGNGVLVDSRQGNWSEGLATYVADYLYKENSSAEEAREYRLQILRNFSTLVKEGGDFPLAHFHGRYNPASQAVGYGKGAMVFHMLRRKLGDKAFWEALRDLYRQKLFQEASWQDFQESFEHQGQCDLHSFFDQWLNRTGAPRLFLDSTAKEPLGSVWKVRTFIFQKQPVYELELTVSLESEIMRGHKTIKVSGPSTFFEAPSFGRPEKLLVDPDFHVFRFLHPSEIPPAVNSIKGSESLLILVSGSWKDQGKEVGELLARSLGVKSYRIIAEESLDKKEMEDHDLLYLGLPQTHSIPVNTPKGVVLGPTRFELQGESFHKASDAFFGVFTHGENAKHVVALYLPLSSEGAHVVAGRITHYGKYSTLVFREGKNEKKEIWPVTESPLVYTWEGME
jgi:hypothetical protein